MPYFYAAMGYCEGTDVSKWDKKCPYEWQEELWRRAEWEKRGGGMKKADKEAEKEEDEGQEVWAEEEEDEEEEFDPNADDAIIDDPEDPFNFLRVLQL